MPDVLTPPRSARRWHRMNATAAASFVLGGALFALGACFAQLGATSLTTVNVAYLVGGVFFSLGGYVSILLDKLGVQDRTQAALLAVSLKRTLPKG